MTQKLEIIAEEPDRSFVYKTIAYPHPTCVWHYHLHYELHLIHHAAGKAVVGNYIGDFFDGHLALTGPHLPHNWHSEVSGADELTPQIDYVIQFTPDFANQTIARLPEAMHIRALLNESELGVEFFGAPRAEADAIIQRMENEGSFRRVLSLYEVLDILGRCTERKVMASHNYRFKKDLEIADQVELIAAHIKQNYKKDITQAQVSRRFNMTQETFCRFFKKHFDRGFSKYVNSLRVGEACSLLMETDASVAEIAYNVGFNNISNFNRHFLKIKGTTPRHFRDISKSKDGFFGAAERPAILSAPRDPAEAAETV